MIESSCHCGAVQLRIEADAQTAQIPGNFWIDLNDGLKED